MKKDSSRAWRAWLGAALLLALILRAAVWIERGIRDPEFDQPSLDSAIYLDWAGRIAEGDVFTAEVPGARPYFLNPLYAWILAPIVRVAGDSTLDATRVLQLVLGLASILLVAAAVRRLLGPGVAILSAFLMAADPLLPFYEQVLMIVSVAVFLNSLLLWLLARFADRRTAGATFLAGLALGGAVLARPNVGLFGLLLPVWFLALAPPGRSRIAFAARYGLIVFLGSVVVVLPVALRNALVGKDRVIVTWSSGVNLYLANNARAREQGTMVADGIRPHPVLMQYDQKAIAERDAGRELAPSEVSAWWSRRARREMSEAPGRTAGFLGRKLLQFLAGYELPSSYDYESTRAETVTLSVNPVTWSFLCPLALLGAFVVIHRARGGWPFLLLFVAYAVGLAIFFPLAHYRAPVLPAAFPLAALGTAWLVGAAASGRPRRWLRIGAPVLLVLVVTNVPGLLHALGVADWEKREEHRVGFLYNRGIMAVRRGDLAVAEECFARVRALDPDSPLADHGMSDVAMQRGDLEAEGRYLEAALRKVPNDPPTMARLGLVRFKLGRRTEGVASADRAAALAPDDWIVLSVRGELNEYLGRFSLALRAYEHAVESGLPEIEVLEGQSRCLRALRRPRDALERLDRGLRVAPGHPGLHLEKARALVESGAGVGAVRAETRFAEEAGVPVPPDLRAWLDSRR